MQYMYTHYGIGKIRSTSHIFRYGLQPRPSVGEQSFLATETCDISYELSCPVQLQIPPEKKSRPWYGSYPRLQDLKSNAQTTRSKNRFPNIALRGCTYSYYL